MLFRCLVLGSLVHSRPLANCAQTSCLPCWHLTRLINLQSTFNEIYTMLWKIISWAWEKSVSLSLGPDLYTRILKLFSDLQNWWGFSPLPGNTETAFSFRWIPNISMQNIPHLFFSDPDRDWQHCTTFRWQGIGWKGLNLYNWSRFSRYYDGYPTQPSIFLGNSRISGI